MVPGAGIEPAWGFPQGIFLLTTAFTAACSTHAFGVWTLPLPCREVRFRQGPSSLYTFRAAQAAWLSSGLQSPLLNVDWFTDFDPIHRRRFHLNAQNDLSPLRLPISPPGQGGLAGILQKMRSVTQVEDT